MFRSGSFLSRTRLRHSGFSIRATGAGRVAAWTVNRSGLLPRISSRRLIWKLDFVRMGPEFMGCSPRRWECRARQATVQAKAAAQSCQGPCHPDAAASNTRHDPARPSFRRRSVGIPCRWRICPSECIHRRRLQDAVRRAGRAQASTGPMTSSPR